MLSGGCLLGLLQLAILGHPIVDDRAPVIDADTVGVGCHVVRDSKYLAIPLFSSGSLIDKVALFSRLGYLDIGKVDVLAEVVEAVTILIGCGELIVHSLLLLCQEFRISVPGQALCRSLRLLGSDICLVVVPGVFDVRLEAIFDLLTELGKTFRVQCHA